MRRLGIVILTAGVLLGLGGGAAWGHKGKLPDDALTLIRQASALLAQNPRMTGEVRERLQAALKSRKPQGVHRDQVAAALAALDARDVATARRLLMASIMPAGMPMPPLGPTRTASSQVAGQERATRPTAVPAPAQAPPGMAMPPAPAVQMPPPAPAVEAALEKAEPLRVRFGGSAAELATLAAGVAFLGLGLGLLWRGREALGP